MVDASTTPETPSPVEQVDREAAAQYLGFPDWETLKRTLPNCGWDKAVDLAETFASHRLAERARLTTDRAVGAEATWLPHAGGGCPVDPGATVNTITRSGATATMRAAGVVWRYGSMIYEIMEPLPADAEVVFYRLAALSQPIPEQGVREAVARLLCEQHGGDPDAVATEPHDSWDGPLWTAFTLDADKVIALAATPPVPETNLQGNVAGCPPVPAISEPTETRGGFACPICGDDKPHHHTAPVVDAYQTKGSRK